MSGRVLANVTGVVIEGRALLIDGPPGSGKSSLGLSLIDRGATLIGDDAVCIADERGTLVASPPPNTAGLFEIRNVGLVELPVAKGPVSLILALDPAAPRFPVDIGSHTIAAATVPVLPFAPGDAAQALRAEHALRQHGLPLPKRRQKA
ncbi:MAG: HPr kinase/phosphorylase [Erythrobacter sp.]